MKKEDRYKVGSILCCPICAQIYVVVNSCWPTVFTMIRGEGYYNLPEWCGHWRSQMDLEKIGEV